MAQGCGPAKYVVIGGAGAKTFNLPPGQRLYMVSVVASDDPADGPSFVQLGNGADANRVVVPTNTGWSISGDAIPDGLTGPYQVDIEGQARAWSIAYGTPQADCAAEDLAEQVGDHPFMTRAPR